jgi:hypothetical protein
MKMKIKNLLARWMANRIEKKSRAKRRALRDQRRDYFEYESRENRRIDMEERRARGLHIYAAWSHPSNHHQPRDTRNGFGLGEAFQSLH